MEQRTGNIIIGVCVGAIGLGVLLGGTRGPEPVRPAPAIVAGSESAAPSRHPDIASPSKTVSPKPSPLSTKTAKPKRTVKLMPSRTTRPTHPSLPTKPSAPAAIKLYPVTALGSQATIDRGKLVTWMVKPTCLLAGHDTMGWAWLDNIPTGRTVKVMTGPCAGTYKVVGHKWQSQKGGPIPSWMASYDLVLQTCTGRSGMGFSLLRRA